MADVVPLRGLRYDPETLRSLGNVICPPYDIIGHGYQEELHARSPFNIVRLELGQPHSNDTDAENVYTRARIQLDEWLQQKILIRDELPSLYLVNESYYQEGVLYNRTGFFAAVRLQDYSQKIILPHERTALGPKQDRLNLMQACETSLSPVMGLYRDPGGVTDLLHHQMTIKAPSFTADFESTKYQVWVEQDPLITDKITNLLKDSLLYIADGHHRYETALVYRDNARALGAQSNCLASEYFLACLVELSDPGFQLLSIHRLVTGISDDQKTNIYTRLRALFHIERSKFSTDGRGASRWLHHMTQDDTNVLTLGLLDTAEEYIFSLHLKSDLSPQSLPSASNDDLNRCATWVLHQGVLDPSLGDLSPSVNFFHDTSELDQAKKDGWSGIAFLVLPLELDHFEALVRHGEVLPRKTTYFVPKLPTGLVLHGLGGNL